MAESSFGDVLAIGRNCTLCGVFKLFPEFSVSRKAKYGRKERCIECDKKVRRAQYLANPGRKAVYKQNELAKAAAATATKEGTRCCSTCRVTKDISEYTASRYVPGGLSRRCRSCSAIAMARWKAVPGVKEKYNAVQRERNIKKKYGLTIAEIAAMVSAQGGCAICGNNIKAGTRQCHVDHDHASGRVRGILCHGCNTGIGLFKENPKALFAAVEYLSRDRRRESA